MTITVLQSGGTANDNATNGSRAFGSDVTSGSKVIIASFRYADSDSTTYVDGDCTKTAGTSTVANIALRGAVTVQYKPAQEYYLQAGIWTADVTGAGSLTMQVAGAAGSYWGTSGIELATSTSWEAGFVEDTSTGSSVPDNTNGSTGTMDSAGAGIFIGCLVVSNDGGTVSITPATIGGVSPTTVLEQENEDVNGAGSVVYAIVTGATSDDAAWTLGNNIGWGAVGLVIKEAAGGGGGGTNVSLGGMFFRDALERVRKIGSGWKRHGDGRLLVPAYPMLKVH